MRVSDFHIPNSLYHINLPISFDVLWFWGSACEVSSKSGADGDPSSEFCASGTLVAMKRKLSTQLLDIPPYLYQKHSHQHAINGMKNFTCIAE